jgi:Domain of unknown function (DUF4270)
VKYKYQALIPGTIVITILILLFSCKKINEATTLGGDLIPAVDNITTFDTTLEVEAYNGIFTLAGPDTDSIRLSGRQANFLGNITNDPLFGTSTATIFTQLKPSLFRFSYGFSSPDSLVGLDSVVLVLKYINTFGDSTIPQSVNIYEIDPSASNNFRYDSSYLIRENHITYTGLLGNGTYTPKDLDDSIHLFKDSASHQLRIKLDDTFGQRLLAYDSLSTGTNNAYYSDSLFNTFFKGFAIVPGGTGNALIGINLGTSKLSVYYKYKHGVLDTAVKDFVFTAASASANYIQRDYSGSQLATYSGVTAPHDFVFIQTQPGTFASVKIPGLGSLNNRIIHRAELLVEQAYNDPLDDKLTVPSKLFLDYYDSLTGKYTVSKYDFSATYTSGSAYSFDATSYGMNGKKGTDGAGNAITKWSFNLSRWVQNIVSGKEKYYPLRLYAPFESHLEFTGKINFTNGDVPLYPINPAVAVGRVRLYGGDASKTNPKRMRFRIIYSKI